MAMYLCEVPFSTTMYSTLDDLYRMCFIFTLQRILDHHQNLLSHHEMYSICLDSGSASCLHDGSSLCFFSTSVLCSFSLTASLSITFPFLDGTPKNEVHPLKFNISLEIIYLIPSMLMEEVACDMHV